MTFLLLLLVLGVVAALALGASGTDAKLPF